MLINREQQRVIDEVEQNILLLASAGTGKTNTLAYRVAHLIEGGYAKAENILCMTFTNKASNEMKGRIQSLVGSPAKAVEVSTFLFHSPTRGQAQRNLVHGCDHL